jgi:hypothetical protein
MSALDFFRPGTHEVETGQKDRRSEPRSRHCFDALPGAYEVS